jgi:hypothetical protein
MEHMTMDRITEKQLLAAIGVMGAMMDIPSGPVWTRDEKGNNRARVGALVLNTGSKLYGNAWCVAQIANESGGERTLLRASTKRELWDAIYSWREGYDHAKRESGK